jgi:hypothetical protein
MHCAVSLDDIMLGTHDSHLDVLSTDAYIGCTLIRHGLMLSAPGNPSVAITIQALELYRLAHFRCPQLSISAFVKALSDIHSVRFRFHEQWPAILTPQYIASIQKILCIPVLHRI